MAGRPKGSTNDRLWRDALRKIALEYHEGKAGPRKIEMAARKLVEATINGDMSAAREFGLRLDGNPHQTVDLAVTDERSVIRSPQPSDTPADWATTYTPKPH